MTRCVRSVAAALMLAMARARDGWIWGLCELVVDVGRDDALNRETVTHRKLLWTFASSWDLPQHVKEVKRMERDLKAGRRGRRCVRHDAEEMRRQTGDDECVSEVEEDRDRITHDHQRRVASRLAEYNAS